MDRAGAIGLGVAIVAVLTFAQAEGGPEPQRRLAASVLEEIGPFVLRSPVIGSTLEGPSAPAGSSARVTACDTWALSVGDAEQSAVRLMHAEPAGPDGEQALAVSLTTIRVAARAAAWTPGLAPPGNRPFRSVEAAASQALGVADRAGSRVEETAQLALMRAIAAVRSTCA